MQRFYSFILFKILGWRKIGESPKDIKKYVLTGLPHTSNWDFLYGWLAAQALGLETKIFVKDAYFFWPLNYVCKWLGLLPVNRRKSTNFVDTMVEKFEEHEELHLFIAPEGTRKRVERLKSGYYHLARKAGVPIVVAGPNYEQKTYTIMTPREPLDSFEDDQQQIIDFAKKQVGRIPSNSFQ